MDTYIAFLRGINVGTHLRMPMTELKALCESIGFESVHTYIQSGNVIFQSAFPEAVLIEKLEQALYAKEQKQVPVVIRSAEALKKVFTNNPFPDGNPSQVGVLFFVEKVPRDLLKDVTLTGPEVVEASVREVYIHYPNGMSRSKLKLPLMQQGTVRNMNTVSKIIALIQ